MDDTPTESLLSALEASDPATAVVLADEVAARLGAALVEEGEDAGAPQA